MMTATKPSKVWKKNWALFLSWAPKQEKPFTSYVWERKRIALCVSAQTFRPIPRLVVSFSKQLVLVAEGWPECLWAVAVTAHLVGEASIFTPGKHLDIRIPHQVQGVLEAKGHKSLKGERLVRYQALLLDTPDVTNPPDVWRLKPSYLITW